MPQTANDNLVIDLGVLSAEPADEYHAKAGEYLSSHQLLDFMACPWLYRKKQLGLIADTDTPALLLGRATHVRILEGRDAYETQFAIGGPINPRTGKPYGSNTQAFRRWAEAQGKPVLSHDNVDLIEQMASGVAMRRCVFTRTRRFTACSARSFVGSRTWTGRRCCCSTMRRGFRTCRPAGRGR
jgi:hypothetical protein